MFRKIFSHHRALSVCMRSFAMRHHAPNVSSPSFLLTRSRPGSSQPGETANKAKKDVANIDDPFSSPTYNILEKPVTFVEGASYSVVILVGLGMKQLFESRNRAARQRIPHRVWTDEDGAEHVEVNFYIRGPHGHGKVFSVMFKGPTDNEWKFMYLIVEIRAPSTAQIIPESYIPSYNAANADSCQGKCSRMKRLKKQNESASRLSVVSAPSSGTPDEFILCFVALCVLLEVIHVVNHVVHDK
ncbi:hypothetical protein Fmac_020637 [Flemingia macrophylla]|uniref:Mitochondrial import inner membrane translocase subunit Tim21 n=1 Tax=Flemingia macrophylla TaxID=520843 RepID=A0ABD1LUJ2_9FABA